MAVVGSLTLGFASLHPGLSKLPPFRRPHDSRQLGNFMRFDCLQQTERISTRKNGPLSRIGCFAQPTTYPRDAPVGGDSSGHIRQKRRKSTLCANSRQARLNEPNLLTKHSKCTRTSCDVHNLCHRPWRLWRLCGHRSSSQRSGTTFEILNNSGSRGSLYRMYLTADLFDKGVLRPQETPRSGKSQPASYEAY